MTLSYAHAKIRGGSGDRALARDLNEVGPQQPQHPQLTTIPRNISVLFTFHIYTNLYG